MSSSRPLRSAWSTARDLAEKPTARTAFLERALSLAAKNLRTARRHSMAYAHAMGSVISTTLDGRRPATPARYM